MLEFARAAGKSIGDLEMQLDFLFKELLEGYKTVLAALKTATSVKAASDNVLLNFEKPANQSDAVKKLRAGYAQEYFDKYAGTGAAATYRTYTVKAGDSLWAIAAKQLGNGSRYKEIKSLNGLTSDVINAGQVLKLPN